ncbi:uncharacterized protein MYCFIDRAFT_210267 [Pseudocercospora fijiensis CIRAD86]|uniref:Uncharacterized protein n=1 Tax=Pseudocercospora fijiensis (strain CIRAD86) TaxID=383855 RepID=M3B8B8_PSEFD|nr:uncharacterized protein MYCFIDRAFT_210267 [Pseudocercospora fijiensis CIRAD86]EME85567.1 hypothetical protein MYCFIDRAFT_210267 [Pseudocercospora fijiensis CIRAD86]
MTYQPTLLSLTLFCTALTAFIFIIGSLGYEEYTPRRSNSIEESPNQNQEQNNPNSQNLLLLERIPLPIREKLQALPAEEREVMMERHGKEKDEGRRGEDVQSVLEEFRGEGLDGDLSCFAAIL